MLCPASIYANAIVILVYNGVTYDESHKPHSHLNAFNVKDPVPTLQGYDFTSEISPNCNILELHAKYCIYYLYMECCMVLNCVLMHTS